MKIKMKTYVLDKTTKEVERRNDYRRESNRSFSRDRSPLGNVKKNLVTMQLESPPDAEEDGGGVVDDLLVVH